MSQSNCSIVQEQQGSRKAFLFVTLFLLITIAGLMYVKWMPYYQKAFTAAAKHSIGSSILTGKEAVSPSPSLSAAWDYALTYYKAVWKAAVFGILLGTLVQVLLPAQWLLNVLGKHTLKSTFWGGLASLPGMMCSCCAAPIAVGLRKKNVSTGASLAFWLGNPTLNPATLIFMTFVLSWKFTLLRLVFGLLLTFGVSYFAKYFAGDTQTELPLNPLDTSGLNEGKSESLLVKWLKSIWKMILYIVPSYIIAVFLLGAVRAWLFPAIGEGSFGGVLSLIVFAIAGTLFVIPTAAEIPIIQTFLSFGMGTGTATALLLTLPAISLPSLLMINRSFPRRVVWFVFFSVVAIGILSGIAGALFL